MSKTTAGEISSACASAKAGAVNDAETSTAVRAAPRGGGRDGRRGAGQDGESGTGADEERGDGGAGTGGRHRGEVLFSGAGLTGFPTAAENRTGTRFRSVSRSIRDTVRARPPNPLARSGPGPTDRRPRSRRSSPTSRQPIGGPPTDRSEGSRSPPTRPSRRIDRPRRASSRARRSCPGTSTASSARGSAGSPR